MRLDLGVPALTLLNPWPAAIVADIPDPKRVENRPWPAPQSIDRLLIHAGKGHDGYGYDALERFGVDLPEPLPAGVIVALAELAYVCDATVYGRAPCTCGRWAVRGQYHWRLGRVWVLPAPVACRGFQRLWQPPADVRAAVQEQLAEAVAR